MGSNLASWFRVIVLGVAFSAGLPSVSLPAAPHTAIASVIPNGFSWQDEVVDQLGDVGQGASIWDGVAWTIDTVDRGLGADLRYARALP